MTAKAIRHHSDLEVWKRAILLAKRIYVLTATLPSGERYSLAIQMRRSAVSVPANIAEGAARGTTREFCRFIRIALGSLAELETYVVLTDELHGLQFAAELSESITVLRRMLICLRLSLQNRVICR